MYSPLSEASQKCWGYFSTVGNTFVTFHTGDGATLPAMANVHVIANNGKLFATAGAFPNITDACALGSTSLMWSDLFLASGAVIILIMATLQ